MDAFGELRLSFAGGSQLSLKLFDDLVVQDNVAVGFLRLTCAPCEDLAGSMFRRSQNFLFVKDAFRFVAFNVGRSFQIAFPNGGDELGIGASLHRSTNDGFQRMLPGRVVVKDDCEVCWVLT